MTNAYIERLIDEREKLEEKIEKLREFIGGDFFSNLEKESANLLKEQLRVMEHYSEILRNRLLIAHPE